MYVYELNSKCNIILLIKQFRKELGIYAIPLRIYMTTQPDVLPRTLENMDDLPKRKVPLNVLTKLKVTLYCIRLGFPGIPPRIATW